MKAITEHDDHLTRLKTQIHSYPSLLTAYSGGIDSTLVAWAARKTLGKQAAPAVIADSPSLPRSELEAAISLATELDIQLHTIQPNEQHDPDYQANQGNRCYFCKSHLYTDMIALAEKLGIKYLANGTNADDTGDHRPGLTAASEAKIVSPLLDAGLTKTDVRRLAQKASLPNWDKPAAACLASRIPYGTPVTPERLTQIENAETALQTLGLSGFRVRYHDSLARIELQENDLKRSILEHQLRDQIILAVKAAGFTYVSLDLEGFRSGSGNLILTINQSNPTP
ncbi:ATP-dependent sacrificial sulfur transferase LarE [Poriferisphaera sp. WC338]|uniref:ATP-dependent sacrificial sulfur transferase LarE n=1 Tax=Poriferisphaera sp. WC338 TaxID=3425129 RepID=UPI003D8181A4